VLEKIKGIKNESKRFSDVIALKIEKLQEIAKVEQEKANSELAFLEGLLLRYMQTVDAKQTKTQASYKLPSAKLVLKKEKKVLKVDKKIFLEYAKEYEREFVKTTESLDWATMKKNYSIVGDKIISNLTGEVVELEGLEIETKKSNFEVKYND